MEKKKEKKMILPVSNSQTKSLIRQNLEHKSKIGYLSQSNSPNQASERSPSAISFKGITYNGIEYSDDEITDAKKYMHEVGTEWKQKLHKITVARLRGENMKGVEEIMPGVLRPAYALITWGITELGIAFYNHKGAPEGATRHVDRVTTLIQHIKNEDQLKANETRQDELDATRRRLAREAKEADRRNEAALAKTEYTTKLNDLNNQLRTEFCDKVNMEKQGSHIEKMPNAIMIEDPYDDVSKELVDYTRRNSESRFIRLFSGDNDTLMDYLDETLKKAKAHFDSTKERTLVHVEGFDGLITKGQNSFENIDSLKDIMCRCAKDFGSTIIFRTKDASKLVSEAIQPQRVAVRIFANFRSVR